MSGGISLLIGAIQSVGISLLPSAVLAKVPSPTIVWLGIGAGCIFWAAYLAWRDERHEVEKIESELAEERSIKNAPEIYLRFQQSGLHTGFVASNNTAGRNANRVSIGRIATAEWILDTETIDVLVGQQELPIKARMSQRSSGSQEMYPDYNKLFADLCADGFDAQRFVTLTYGNASGLSFARDVRVSTNLIALAGEVKDAFTFSHGRIRKSEKPNR